MPQGKVKWFADEKGYGFITPDDGGDEVFVHHSDIVAEGFRTLDADARVKFEVRETDKGMRAFDVEVV